MSDELRKAALESLAAIQETLEGAYHRCFPECCGRPGSECCGNPKQSWSPDDKAIMATLGPAEKALRSALAATEEHKE